MFKLFPIYSAHKSSNHKFSKKFKKKHTHTRLVLAHIYGKRTQTSNTIFSEEVVPSVSPLFKKKKKHIRLGHAGIVDYSVHFTIPDF